MGGHLEAERLGGLQVDDELELGRLHDRQVGGLLTLEDPAGIDADLTIRIRNVSPVAHQPAGFSNFTRSRCQGYRMARCQGRKLHPPGGK